MTTLVTGAAGFVGSHLVQALLARGERVVGLDNFCPNYAPERKRSHLADIPPDAPFRLVEGDIRDTALLSTLVADEKVSRVAHLAALAGVQASVENPQEVLSVDTLGTQSVASAAAGLPLVFLSSSSVYGSRPGQEPFLESDAADRPESPYAAAKRAAELLLAAHHSLTQAPVTILRPFTIYGPRQRPDMAIPRFAASLDQGLPIPVFFGGEAMRDMTYVGDVVQGILAALDAPNGFLLHNLGSGKCQPVTETIQTLARLMGKEATMEPRPAPPGDVPRTLADTTLVARHLGWWAMTSVEDGLKAYLEWRASGTEGPVEPAA
ncbi:GDP-mannose 4,6-dehydratase [bacterium]|nr:GDP-mannose 4,6-dehydratase [bacterium]